MSTATIAPDAAALIEAARTRLKADARAARPLAERALEAARSEGHAWLVCDAFLVLGECCEALSEHSEAIAHLERALEAATAAGDIRREAQAHRLLAFIDDNLANFESAMEHHLQALSRLERLGDDRTLAQVLRTIGVSASKSKDAELGLAWYRRSLEIARRVGDDDSVGRTLNNIGLDLKNLGRLEESRAAFEEAIAVFERMGARHLQSSCYGNFAHTLDMMGRDAEAESAYARAIALSRELATVHSLANALIGRGRLYVKLGRLGEAGDALREGLALSERVGYRPDVSDALEALAKLEKARGDAAAALAYFERFHEVTRGMLLDESQRRLKGLELRVRVNHAQREAEAQRRRSEELSDAYDRLQAAVAEKNELVTLLERQSREDAVTGLGNRRMLEETLAGAFAEARAAGTPLCLALLEADDFQQLADKASHSAVDAALSDIARMVRANIRGQDRAARLAGGQFAIVFPDTDPEQAARICDDIRIAVQARDWAGIDPWMRLTLSGGIVHLRRHDTPVLLMLEADTRLRVAKVAGGNRLDVSEAREPPAGAAAAAPARDAGDPRPAMILAEQVRASYANLPIAYGAGLVVATLLCLAVRDLVAVRVWGTWLAALVAVSAMLWYLERGFRRERPAGAEARRWGHLAALGSLAVGGLWGLGTVLLHTADSIDYQIMVAATAAIIGSSVAFASATYLPPFFAFSFPAVLPTAIMFIDKTDTARVVIGWLLLCYLALVSRFAVTLNREFIEALRLRFENVALVSELRERQEAAEAANRAKSRFLAAASHDLRQPTHALGLFLQVLRQARLGERERELVDNIGQSFAAMEALFNALLDISRLDAGVVEPQVSVFPVARLLERMRAEYAPQAKAKGLALSVQRSSAYVRCDPVLLEEMIGNLLSNAVRHTGTGRVLLGCRREQGHLRIEVWDTGPGIPTDKQREVFGEFVQLDNPERDRRKGLGLGLAIVDRLCKLLGCTLELHSQPGRGSLFRVTVPLGRREDADAAEPSVPMSALAPLEGRLVTVVDDEPTVLTAMSSLLGSWGLQVVSAESGAMVLGKLASASRAPDAVLCDYRLRSGESGIEVIRAIREEFNMEIPAALITGDTDPDRLKEARASGLPLLHKPVTPSRLRALLAQMLRTEGDGPAAT